MKNTTILKRFVRNTLIFVAAVAAFFVASTLSGTYLGSEFYPVLALMVGMLLYMLWGISQNQLESEAREKRDATTLME